MMLLGNFFQPKTAKKNKNHHRIVDIKDGLIRTVRREKKSCYYLQKIFKGFQKILLSGEDTIN